MESQFHSFQMFFKLDQWFTNCWSGSTSGMQFLMGCGINKLIADKEFISSSMKIRTKQHVQIYLCVGECDLVHFKGQAEGDTIPPEQSQFCECGAHQIYQEASRPQ